MRKIILLLATLSGCLEYVPTGGLVDEVFVCESRITCNGETRVQRDEVCAVPGSEDFLFEVTVQACEDELAARGCEPHHCGGYCEGKGYRSTTGIAELCWGW